jgi:hypothetical protein
MTNLIDNALDALPRHGRWLSGAAGRSDDAAGARA